MDKSFKILVVSNNSISQTNSNGRTLGNYFKGWHKENIAQFCISTTEPDLNICDNYYCIPDSNAFSAFIHFRKAKRKPIEECINTAANTKILSNKPSIKTATKALLRNIIWRNRWNSKDLWEWIDEFNPTVILVMYSDSAFILNIARSIAEKRNLPLVMYNTEGFYFFEHDFMKETLFLDKISFSLYKAYYRKEVRKLMKRTSLSMHLNGKLKKDFEKEFGGWHEVLYSSSSMTAHSYICDTENPVFNYLGNFGYDRPSALVEIAEVLNKINPVYKLHVYGKIPSEEIADKLKKCPSIQLEGFVNYDEVQTIMYGSTILFHAESQDKKYEETLRYGFTTKIADSLSCGVPFVMYSLPSVAGADYLVETKAGWYASNREQLKLCIESILNNKIERDAVLANAAIVASQNHNEENNRTLFKDYIKKAIEQYES